jgi:hypothetical protein
MAELIKTVTTTYMLSLTESEIQVIKSSLEDLDFDKDQVRISDELLMLIERVLNNG